MGDRPLFSPGNFRSNHSDRKSLFLSSARSERHKHTTQQSKRRASFADLLNGEDAFAVSGLSSASRSAARVQSNMTRGPSSSSSSSAYSPPGAKKPRHMSGHASSPLTPVRSPRIPVADIYGQISPGLMANARPSTRLNGSASPSRRSPNRNGNGLSPSMPPARRLASQPRKRSQSLVVGSSTKGTLNQPADLALELLNRKYSKFNMSDVLNISSEAHFHAEMEKHSKFDVQKLCWKLLGSLRQFHELMHIASTLNQNLDDPHKPLATISKITCDVLQAKCASLYVLTEDRAHLQCVWREMEEIGEAGTLKHSTSAHTSHAYGGSASPVDDIYIDATGMTIPARVLTSRAPVLESLTSNSPSLCPDYDGFGYVHVLGLPVYDTDMFVTGVLMVYRDRSHHKETYDDYDVSLAQFIASLASSTLQNVQLYQKIQSRHKETDLVLHMIDQMGGDISAGHSSVIRNLVRSARLLVKCAKIEFFSIDQEQRQLVTEVSFSRRNEGEIISLKSGGLLAKVATTGRSIKIDNSRYETRFSRAEISEHSSGKSILVVPVLDSNLQPIAVIQAIDRTASGQRNRPFRNLRRARTTTGFNTNDDEDDTDIIPFTDTDKRMLETLANSSGVILRNAILFEEVNGLRRKNEALVNVMKELHAKENGIVSVLNFCAQHIHEVVDARRIIIWFLDSHGNLDSLSVMGDDLQNEMGLQHDLVRALAAYVTETSTIVSASNIFTDPELLDDILPFVGDEFDLQEFEEFQMEHAASVRAGSGPRCAVLCVPIETATGVMGCIEVTHKKGGGPFLPVDVSILEAVSNEIAKTMQQNISELWIRQLIQSQEDVPLDVLDYYFANPYYDRDDDDDDGDDEFYINPNGNDDVDILSDAGTEFAMEHRLVKVANTHRAVPLTSPVHLDTAEEDLMMLQTAEFDATAHDKRRLESFAMAIFEATGVVDHFNVDRSCLGRFIHSVQKNYRDNYFHNWQHGFSVLQFCYHFLHSTQIHLSKLDMFAVLVACMCHDVAHPGNDNVYEVNKDSELARIYNNQSVLENHHSYTTLALLRKTETNFLRNLPQSKQREFRDRIVKCILHTDMTHHLQSVEWVRDLVKERQSAGHDGKPVAKQNIVKVLMLITHLGDLSPQTYPWRVAKIWEHRIAQEFYHQTRREEQKRLPTRDFMKNIDIPNRFKNQHFFIEHVLKPLWEPSGLCWDSMRHRFDELQTNSKLYHQVANEHLQRKQQTEAANGSAE